MVYFQLHLVFHKKTVQRMRCTFYWYLPMIKSRPTGHLNLIVLIQWSKQETFCPETGPELLQNDEESKLFGTKTPIIIQCCKNDLPHINREKIILPVSRRKVSFFFWALYNSINRLALKSWWLPIYYSICLLCAVIQQYVRTKVLCNPIPPEDFVYDTAF